jgi:uncharacterized protein (TIGR03067 family)
LTTAAVVTTTGVLIRQANVRARDAAAPKVAKKPKTDKEALQGTWLPVAVEEAGKKISEKAIKAKNFEMVIKGNKITLPIKDDTVEAEFKLAPTKSPKQIDLFLGKGKTAKGIYLLKGDQFKLCVEADQGGERPTEFATAGTARVLMVLKRK